MSIPCNAIGRIRDAATDAVLKTMRADVSRVMYTLRQHYPIFML